MSWPSRSNCGTLNRSPVMGSGVVAANHTRLRGVAANHKPPESRKLPGGQSVAVLPEPSLLRYQCGTYVKPL